MKSNAQVKAALKAARDLEKELDKQLDIIYPAAVIILWKEYGYRKLRILRRFVTTQEIWHECSESGTKKSLLSMLEDETGIEMTLDGVKSYHEFAYLDWNIWDGNLVDPLQAIYMRKRQKMWLAPLIQASICLALHRDDGWGYDRIARFMGYLNRMRQELGEDPKVYQNMMEELTDIDREQLLRREPK